MKVFKQDLAKKVGMNPNILTTYLCRVEFAHIQAEKVGVRLQYSKVTKQDIERLTALKKCNRCMNKGYVPKYDPTYEVELCS